MLSGTVFGGAEETWEHLMKAIADYVNENGGKAIVNPEVSKRLDWEKDVKPQNKF